MSYSHHALTTLKFQLLEEEKDLKYEKKVFVFVCIFVAHSHSQLVRCTHTGQLSNAVSRQSFSLSASSHC